MIDQWGWICSFMRDLENKCPALMAYAKVLTAKELDDVKVTGAAAPGARQVRAQGQTMKAIKAPYSKKPEKCSHNPDLQKKYGNNFGMFKECLQCGTVWKGFHYSIPGTQDHVSVHPHLHGHRRAPGGNIQGTKDAQAKADLERLRECYSLSAGSSRYTTETSARASRRSTTSAPAPATASTSVTTSLRRMTPQQREEVRLQAAQRVQDQASKAAKKAREVVPAEASEPSAPSEAAPPGFNPAGRRAMKVEIHSDPEDKDESGLILSSDVEIVSSGPDK